MSRPKTARSARPRGFTLIELMVALTVGGLAISAMYTIGSNLIRHYHSQQQASNAMTTLRVALNQLKRDIGRAGYLATPNLFPYAPWVSLNCGAAAPVAGSLAGIAGWGNDVCTGGSTCSNVNPDSSTANSANGFTADTLLLHGNYETSAEYPNVQRVTASTISIGRSAHAYQSDFTQWYAGNPAVPDTNALMRAFAPGRMIRIRTTTGRHHFATVNANGVVAESGATDAQLTFTPAIPTDCLAAVDGGWVAPISAIRYFADNDPNPPTPAPWGPMARLVRQEVQPGAPNTALALTEPANNAFTYTNTRVVLDYLVGFNLGFVVTTPNGPNAPDTYTPGADTASVATVTNSPELVRAVTIRLAVRTPEQDRSLPFTSCGPNRPCYQVFNDRPGAARVRTLSAEVFVPNIAYEGY